ncbi:MAG: hypothetical protein QXK12_08710 [Candidatus Nezhaarchaeales archaeon]
MALPEKIAKAAENVKKAIFRVAGARYLLLEHPYLALELLGAAITSMTLAHERTGLTKVREEARKLGEAYAKLEEQLLMGIYDKVKPDLRLVKEEIDKSLDRLVTLYKEIVTG